MYSPETIVRSPLNRPYFDFGPHNPKNGTDAGKPFGGACQAGSDLGPFPTIGQIDGFNLADLRPAILDLCISFLQSFHVLEINGDKRPRRHEVPINKPYAQRGGSQGTSHKSHAGRPWRMTAFGGGCSARRAL